jgi:hypothetical protein
VTWFDATTGQYAQVSYPAQPTQSTQPTPVGAVVNRPTLAPATPQKRGNGVLTTIIILALILGGVYAGHYFGLYTLPFLTDSVNEEADSTDVEDSAEDGETVGERPPDETGQPLETATPTPITEESPTPAGDDEEDIAIVEEAPQLVTLNRDLVALIGLTNKQLLEANGSEGSTIYYWGGSPWADYTESEALYPVRFWLSGDYDLTNATMERIREIENARGEYPGNIWPEDFMIDGIEVWQGPYDFNTTLQELFHADVPLNFENMSASFEKDGVLNYWPLAEQVYDGYGFDVWECIFVEGIYRIMCTFHETNGELMLYRAAIWWGN